MKHLSPSGFVFAWLAQGNQGIGAAPSAGRYASPEIQCAAGGLPMSLAQSIMKAVAPVQLGQLRFIFAGQWVRVERR